MIQSIKFRKPSIIKENGSNLFPFQQKHFLFLPKKILPNQDKFQYQVSLQDYNLVEQILIQPSQTVQIFIFCYEVDKPKSLKNQLTRPQIIIKMENISTFRDIKLIYQMNLLYLSSFAINNNFFLEAEQQLSAHHFNQFWYTLNQYLTQAFKLIKLYLPSITSAKQNQQLSTANQNDNENI